MGKPLCHLFTTYRNFYLYDTNRNIVKQISGTVYEILNQCLRTGRDFYTASSAVDNSEFQKFYLNARRNGLLNEHRVKKIEHPATPKLNQLLNRGLNRISLQVTQMCNLRCEYCPYSGVLYENREHSNRRMSWDTAKRSLDFYIDNSSEARYANIGFYGGEPLLEFELIQKCVAYLESKVIDKDIRYSITTNATLLNDDIIRFFANNNFSVMISLDGPEEIHDRYRRFVDGRGSFSIIIENIRKIKNLYPDYFNKQVRFNAVINRNRAVGDINDFFEFDSTFANSKIIPSGINDRDLKDGISINSTDDFIKSMRYESFKTLLDRMGLYSSVSERPSVFTNMYLNIRDIAGLLRPMEQLPEICHPGGPCIPGLKKFFISVDGKFFPCERLDERSTAVQIGDLDSGIDIAQVARVINVGKLTEEECKNCWAFIFCSQCCANCNTKSGLSREARLQYCKSIRNKITDKLREYCFYREFGYDFGIQKTYYFSKEGSNYE